MCPEKSRSLSRFLSNPFIIMVPFFVIFSLNKGTLNQKGKRVLLRNPVFMGPGRIYGLRGLGLEVPFYGLSNSPTVYLST